MAERLAAPPPPDVLRGLAPALRRLASGSWIWRIHASAGAHPTAGCSFRVRAAPALPSVPDFERALSDAVLDEWLGLVARGLGYPVVPDLG